MGARALIAFISDGAATAVTATVAISTVEAPRRHRGILLAVAATAAIAVVDAKANACICRPLYASATEETV